MLVHTLIETRVVIISIMKLIGDIAVVTSVMATSIIINTSININITVIIIKAGTILEAYKIGINRFRMEK